MSNAGIHITGMGVLGSALAWELSARGVPFTWSDTRAEHAAWKASGGAIYPSPDPLDRATYETWRARRERPEYEGLLEEAVSWYCTKAPPHGARYKPAAEVGPLKASPPEQTSLYLDVRGFVERTRRAFDLCEGEPGAGDREVVAHGYTGRRGKYLWGWTAEVELYVDPRVVEASGGHRPSFYLREGRFVLAYVGPLAGTDRYLLGTSMVSQTTAKELEVRTKVEKSSETVSRLSGGLVEVDRVHDIRQGWRPMPAERSAAEEAMGPLRLASEPFTGVDILADAQGRVIVPAMAHGGVRHSPAVVDGVLTALGIKAPALEDWATEEVEA